MSNYFKGKTAVVTGAASGFGLGISERLLALGAKHVWMADFNEAQLGKEAARLAERYGDKVTPITANSMKREEVEGVIDRAAAEDGQLDFVFNNAGRPMTKPTEQIDPKEFEDLVQLNYLGVVYGVLAALKYTLPGNPLGLALVLALIFCVATPFVNSLLLAFYGITDFTFPRFVFWKAVYSFVLSMILLEVAVLRFVQSDCDEPGQPPQTGADAVRNPLPRAAALKSWFGSVTSDFGFNMISGLLLGGTQIIDGSVVIFPSTLSGIGVSAVVLGLIVSLRMTLPLAKSIRSSALDGSLPPLEREDKWLSWLPGSPAGFAAALFPLVAALAYIVFGSIMTLFDFQVLNFFQFFILRSIFMALLTKAVVWLAVRRWRQPSFASTHGA